MPKLSVLLAGSALAACLAILSTPGAAVAGPCTADINEIGQALNNSSALGAPVTGTLSGSAPGAIAPATAPTETAATPAPDANPASKVGGDAGMKAMNEASSQVATSAADVRLQQQGKPTSAQGGKSDDAMDKMTMAKNELEKARTLDSQGSKDCAGAVQEARKLMQGS